MLGEEELEDLREDIEKNGLVEPIVLYEGKILDGRNRETACQWASIRPQYVEYTGDDPIAYVVSKNLKRRHLTTSQRAMIAEKVANMPAHRPSKITKNLGLTQEEAAKKFNVSDESIRQARKVRTDAIPEVADAVESGKLPVSLAATLADATPEQQREVIAEDDKKAIFAAEKMLDGTDKIV